MENLTGAVFKSPTGGFVCIYRVASEAGKFLIRKCLKDGSVKGLPRIDKVALADLGERIY